MLNSGSTPRGFRKSRLCTKLTSRLRGRAYPSCLISWGRLKSSDHFGQLSCELNRGSVFPHRPDDLHTHRKTCPGSSYRRDGGRQPCQGCKSDPEREVLRVERLPSAVAIMRFSIGSLWSCGNAIVKVVGTKKTS